MAASLEPMHSQSYKRYVTVLLLIVYVFNQTDRAIFGFLMEPIKRELGFSDTQLGFLAGPALVLFYATLGIPIARWGDRSNRVNIMAVAIALWSGIVTLSAAVMSFGQLALARIGVGIGEAGFSALAQTLITDYHERSEHTRALSIFMLGIPLGLALSNLLGGWINEAYGWRAAFIAAGAPGLLLAILLKCTVRDPWRVSTPTQSVRAQQPPLADLVKSLWARPALRHLMIAMTLLNILMATVHTWVPAFFMRNHGLSSGELGSWIAMITGGGAALGAFASANLVSQKRAMDEQSQARTLAICAALVGPLLIAAFLWQNARGALSILFPAYVLSYFLLGPMWSLLQGMCNTHTRATVSAIAIFAQTVAAAAFGIQLVGIMSDVFAARVGEGVALQWTLLLSSLLAIWGAAHLWIAARWLREAEPEARKLVQTDQLPGQRSHT